MGRLGEGEVFFPFFPWMVALITDRTTMLLVKACKLNQDSALLANLIYSLTQPDSPLKTLVKHLSGLSRPLCSLYVYFFVMILEFKQKMRYHITECMVVRRT